MVFVDCDVFVDCGVFDDRDSCALESRASLPTGGPWWARSAKRSTCISLAPGARNDPHAGKGFLHGGIKLQVSKTHVSTHIHLFQEFVTRFLRNCKPRVLTEVGATTERKTYIHQLVGLCLT